MQGNGLQPGAERAEPFALEARQLPDQHAHDLLHQVFGLRAESRIAKQPTMNQRPIELVETLPIGFGGLVPQALEQADGRFHEALGGRRLSRLCPGCTEGSTGIVREVLARRARAALELFMYPVRSEDSPMLLWKKLQMTMSGPEVRLDTIRQLAHSKDPGAVDILIEALKDLDVDAAHLCF